MQKELTVFGTILFAEVVSLQGQKMIGTLGRLAELDAGNDGDGEDEVSTHD